MNDTAATSPSPPARLRVTSAAEAAKIREYAEAWLSLEQSARRLEKTKRWKTARQRVNEMNIALAPHVMACADSWFEWQLLRAMRAIKDALDPKVVNEGVNQLVPLKYWMAVQPHVEPGQDAAWRWFGQLLRAAIFNADDIETAFLVAAEPLAERCRKRLQAASPKTRWQLHNHSFDRVACGVLTHQANLDAGQLAGLAISLCADSLVRDCKDPDLFARLIGDEGLDAHRTEFLQLAATMRGVHTLAMEQALRRDRIFQEIQPPIVPPPPEWRDARLVAWLYDASLAQLWHRLSARYFAPAPQTKIDTAALLGARLCWRLWLDEQWEAARLGPPTAEPQRAVLRQLVENPARFLRFPYPTPEIAAMRRVLRPVSDLLEGSPLAVERDAVLAALARESIAADELLDLLSEYCAHRWRAGIAPKIATRLIERFTSFLQDEILPQAPDILGGCAVEVGPALRTTFDAEFEKLLLAEEAAQEQLAAELRQHAEMWRQRVPAKTAAARERAALAETLVRGDEQTGVDEQGQTGPVVLRYVLNLGEPRPRELRLETTWPALEDELEAFCGREGIRVNIPFSSIAHALAQYVLRTPPERKHVWPERETYGPLELHKIKRGGMRLLVRESPEGLWLHLLQRKDWFLGQP